MIVKILHYGLMIGLLPLFLGADWLQFRGSDQKSLAVDSKLPQQFSKAENIAWKVDLPGHGVSGPIVVGDKVYVTASSGAVKQDHLHVLAFDVASGKQVWKREFWATGRCFHHPTSANAAPTPASDGERIFAFYSSNDLVCLDLVGNLLWYRGLASDYPKAGNDVGMSSSPLVIDETVIVQVENQGDSFAAGIDVATGENRWRIDRPKGANWASPAAIPTGEGKGLVLLQSAKGLVAVEPKTGKEIWSYAVECSGIPSATVVDDKIFLPANGLTVLEASVVATPKLVYDNNRLAPGNSSPVVEGGYVYILSRAGILICGEEKTGKLLWQQRLKGTFWATPVFANGLIYCVNQDGQCFVVKPSESKGELISTNELEDTVLASPAISGDSLFIRADTHLYRVANAK